MLNKEMNTNFTNINMGMGMEMNVWLEIFELKYETKLSFAVPYMWSNKVWYSMVWYGMIWYGMIWYGILAWKLIFWS